MTSLRNAFSPAASRTAQKRHPAEKLLPLPWSNSASSQAQPSGLAIALKAFCKTTVDSTVPIVLLSIQLKEL